MIIFSRLSVRTVICNFDSGRSSPASAKHKKEKRALFYVSQKQNSDYDAVLRGIFCFCSLIFVKSTSVSQHNVDVVSGRGAGVKRDANVCQATAKSDNRNVRPQRE